MTATRSITVRDVPADVHKALVARAARRGQSLQEYVLAELERAAARPALPELLDDIRARKAATATRLPAKRILAHRDADRK